MTVGGCRANGIGRSEKAGIIENKQVQAEGRKRAVGYFDPRGSIGHAQL